MLIKHIRTKVVYVKRVVNRRKISLNYIFRRFFSFSRLNVYLAFGVLRERIYERYKVVGEEYTVGILTSVGPAVPYSYKRAKCISVRICLVRVKRYLQIVVYRYRINVKIRYDSVHRRYYVRRYLLLV